MKMHLRFLSSFDLDIKGIGLNPNAVIGFSM